MKYKFTDLIVSWTYCRTGCMNVEDIEISSGLRNIIIKSRNLKLFE